MNRVPVPRRTNGTGCSTLAVLARERAVLPTEFDRFRPFLFVEFPIVLLLFSLRELLVDMHSSLEIRPNSLDRDNALVQHPLSLIENLKQRRPQLL